MPQYISHRTHNSLLQNDSLTVSAQDIRFPEEAIKKIGKCRNGIITNIFNDRNQWSKIYKPGKKNYRRDSHRQTKYKSRSKLAFIRNVVRKKCEDRLKRFELERVEYAFSTQIN